MSLGKQMFCTKAILDGTENANFTHLFSFPSVLDLLVALPLFKLPTRIQHGILPTSAGTMTVLSILWLTVTTPGFSQYCTFVQ